MGSLAAASTGPSNRHDSENSYLGQLLLLRWLCHLQFFFRCLGVYPPFGEGK